MAVTIYRLTDDGFARVTADALDLRIITAGASAIITVPFTAQAKGDVASIWQNNAAAADWEMIIPGGPALKAGQDLDTALLISLFSDGLAAADDSIPDGTTDRRGWWGDDTLGSKLWLLQRAKLTADIPLRCKDYITDALQWMLDDGVVASIETTTAIQLPNILAAQIQLYRQNGLLIARNFAWVWTKDN